MSRLPRLRIVDEIVDAARRPSDWFVRFWQSTMLAIEQAIAAAATAQETGDGAQGTADDAQADATLALNAAADAQADATQALGDAAAAQADVDALAPTVVLKDQGPAWAAATGTADRTTFDTTTVTTAQLAARVKALIDDLQSNGTLS